MGVTYAPVFKHFAGRYIFFLVHDFTYSVHETSTTAVDVRGADSVLALICHGSIVLEMEGVELSEGGWKGGEEWREEV